MQSTPSTKSPRSNRPLAAFMGVVIVLTILVCVFYGYRAFGPQSSTPVATTTTVASQSTDTTPTTPAAVTTPTASVATPQAAAKAADPTDTWVTTTNATYHVTYKYPQTWGAPQVSTLAPTDDPTGSRFVYDLANFGGFHQTISISSFDSYLQSPNLTPRIDQEVHQLKDVFTNMSANGVTAFWLPPSNAGVLFHTVPQYIATIDGKFRGTYYYAAIGQDYPAQQGNAYKLNDFVATLSDGSSTIVQLQQYPQTTNPDKATYQAADCVDSTDGKASCVVNAQLVTDFTNEFEPLLTGLTKAK